MNNINIDKLKQKTVQQATGNRETTYLLEIEGNQIRIVPATMCRFTEGGKAAKIGSRLYFNGAVKIIFIGFKSSQWPQK